VVNVNRLVSRSGSDTVRAADIFNSAVAVHAVGAAWELGALDELEVTGRLDAADFARRRHLHYPTTLAMFTALSSVDVVTRLGDAIEPGDNFAEVNRSRSLFHWLSRGCGSLFSQMPTVARLGNRSGRFYERDAAAISFACREINARFFDPVFHATLARIEFTSVSDLGCGSAERLIQIVHGRAGVRGVGIDIAAGALAVASVAVADAGLSERISLSEGDVCSIEPRPEYAEVDLVTCFLMGHDFWPREHCVETLRRIRSAFPRVRRFLLGDTTRASEATRDRAPLFTLGFETAHAMMGVYLPSIDEWREVFADGGWHCVREHRIDMPAASVVFELAPV
jgi:hypothetical protein